MWNVKKIEKAMQMEMETLEERILKTYCPHNYGMEDRAAKSDFVCGSDCKACWNEEVEGDSNE
jgi:hypothetical protein